MHFNLFNEVGGDLKLYINHITLVAIASIIFDTITTLYGFILGFEEKNIITQQFILVFGFSGVIIAAVTKIGRLLLPYAVYKRIIRLTNTKGIRITVLEICCVVVAVVAGLSALNAGINNLSVFASSPL